MDYINQRKSIEDLEPYMLKLKLYCRALQTYKFYRLFDMDKVSSLEIFACLLNILYG